MYLCLLVSLLEVVRMPYILFGIVEKFKETNTISAQTLKGMSVGCCLHNLKWCLISQSLTFFVYVILERCRDQNILN